MTIYLVIAQGLSRRRTRDVLYNGPDAEQASLVAANASELKRPVEYREYHALEDARGVRVECIHFDRGRKQTESIHYLFPEDVAAIAECFASPTKFENVVARKARPFGKR